MTNAIEQAKRGYAQAMHDMTHHASGCGPSTVERLRALEDATEEYLELLRQDHEALHETARKRFDDVRSLEAGNEKLSKALRYTNETIQRCAAQSLETIRDLEARLESATNLQKCYELIACDYTEKSADLEKRLAAMAENRDELARGNLAGAKAYGQMKQERDDLQLRLHAVDHAYNEQQRKAGTCGQACADRGASEQPVGKMDDVLAKAVSECQEVVTNWARNGLRAKKAIRAVSAIVNGNAKVLQAMADLESAEVKK